MWPDDLYKIKRKVSGSRWSITGYPPLTVRQSTDYHRMQSRYEDGAKTPYKDFIETAYTAALRFACPLL